MFKNVDIKLLWRVVKLSFSFKKIFYLSLALALLLAPLGALRPYLVNIGVDKYVISNDLSGLFKICIVLVVLVIIESLLRYVFSYATDALGQYVTKDLRIEIFNKIVGLRVRHFDQTPTGMYITRVINDIENIKTIFSEGMLTIIADFIAIIVIVIVMFMTSWQLTLACLVTLPLMVVATIIFNKKVKVSYQRVRTQQANMNAFLQEHSSGMTIIQAFNAQDREANKFKKINKDHALRLS